MFDVPEKYLLETHWKGKKLVNAIVGLSALAIFFFGYDQGVMSGVNQTPDYVKLMGFGTSDAEGTVTITNSTKQGGIVAIYYFGTLCGALVGGYLSDKYGRIKGIALASVWAIFGASLQTSAKNVSWMVGARFVNGIGTGILNCIVPVYSSESALHTSRGAFIAIEFTLNIFGVVVAYWLEYGLSYIDNGFTEFRWRFPLGFQIIPLLVLFASVWVFPESPRWLIKNNERERALRILKSIRGDESGTQEFNEIIASVEFENENLTPNYLRMLFNKFKGDEKSQAQMRKLHISRRVQLVIWLQIIQEWTGIAGITVYQPTIFAQAGFGTKKTQWLSGLNNIFYMFSTLINVVTVDRWGRRFTCFWGAIGQGVSLFLAGGFSKLQQIHPENKSYGAASASFVFMYTSIFGATWLVVPWLIPSEMFPLPLRAAGNAFGVVGWSIGNGWLTLLCPIMFDHIHEKTLYIFGASNFFAIIVVYLFYPETANRTLEEIDWLFESESILASKSEIEFKRLYDERQFVLSGGKNLNVIGHHETIDEEKLMVENLEDAAEEKSID